MRQSFLPRIGIYDAGCIFAQKRDKVKTLSLFLGAEGGISKERSDGTAIAAKQAQTCSVAGRRSRHVISASSLSEQESPLPANGFCGVPEAAKSKSPPHGATGFKAGAEGGI